MTQDTRPTLNVLGTRGVPAAHGGFESFLANFAPYMLEEGWAVTVYCQGGEGVKAPRHWEDEWNGIRRVFFETRTKGSLSTLEFDLKCTMHVLSEPGIDLVLGYNSAIFCLLQRLRGRVIAINMDGIEWQRQKWGAAAKAWFWFNEWVGAKVGQLPIADHPQIAAHLAARGCGKAAVIPYGSAAVFDAPTEPLLAYAIEPGRYFVSIARMEPENSILEIVEAFVAAKTGMKLFVLGKMMPDNAYHTRVKAAADENVLFPGAIYEQPIVHAIRFHALAYVHGHQVGGTNPSLVEALGAGNAVIARENRFNRWVAGDEQFYFTDVATCVEAFQKAAVDSQAVDIARQAARRRHAKTFTFDRIHSQYRDHLQKLLPEYQATAPLLKRQAG